MAFMSLLMITWILTGASRAHLNEPGASRYVYVSGIVALTLLGISITRKALPVMVVALVLWILVLPSGVRVLEQGSGGLRDASFHVRASLFVLDTYSERPSTDFPVEPSRAPQLSAFSYDRLASKYGSIGFSDDEISQLADSYRGTIDDTLMRTGTYRVQPATRTCPEKEESASNKFEMSGQQRVVFRSENDVSLFMRRYSSVAALSVSMQLRGGATYEISDNGAVTRPPLTIEFPGSTVQVCPKSLSP